MLALHLYHEQVAEWLVSLVLSLIVLVACDPEDDTVLLVNQLAASALYPQKGLTMRYPLAIYIDSLRLSMLIRLYRMCCIILHQLQYIFNWFEFTYHNLPGTFRFNSIDIVDQFYNRTIGPWCIRSLVEIYRV